MSELRPPKDDLVRASTFDLHASDDEQPPTMVGHFTVFNAWTEVDSAFEGHFMEQIAPGSFTRTIETNRSDIKVLFQHGEDPQIGDKPLGAIAVLAEDETGPYYEVPLLDAPYVRNDILPGLRAGVYGASFRFRVVRDDVVAAKRDKLGNFPAYNLAGIPERTISEVKLYEFGPVTFPAYAAATAGVRSLTDEFIFDRLRSKPERLRELIDSIQVEAPSDDAEPVLTSKERRGDQPSRFRSSQEFIQWLTSPN